jgi:hypothetical protein
VRVTIGADVVPAEFWARVRPKPAATVIIRVVPAGGSFRTILAIAVTVAAVALGQAYLTPLIAGAFGATAGTFAYAAVSAGVGLAASAAASLAFNALVPLKPPAGPAGNRVRRPIAFRGSRTWPTPTASSRPCSAGTALRRPMR